jgi:peroxiredoxin Q/BCP
LATHLKEGDHAPDATLVGDAGKQVKLSDHIGKKNLILYFYPRDNTPGCTKQACSLRDASASIEAAGAEIIGVSADSPERHEQFAQKYELPFTLLSDTGGSARKAYGVAPVFGIIPKRVTFVIDRQGIIRSIFDSMFNVEEHVAIALKRVETLKTLG